MRVVWIESFSVWYWVFCWFEWVPFDWCWLVPNISNLLLNIFLKAIIQVVSSCSCCNWVQKLFNTLILVIHSLSILKCSIVVTLSYLILRIHAHFIHWVALNGCFLSACTLKCSGIGLRSLSEFVHFLHNWWPVRKLWFIHHILGYFRCVFKTIYTSKVNWRVGFHCLIEV